MNNKLDNTVSQNQNYSGSSTAAAKSRGRKVASGAGGGSKPKALHTEYATGTANQSKPYGGGEDIVFYMKRAG